jgi:hypothetical protein
MQQQIELESLAQRPDAANQLQGVERIKYPFISRYHQGDDIAVPGRKTLCEHGRVKVEFLDGFEDFPTVLFFDGGDLIYNAGDGGNGYSAPFGDILNGNSL